MLLSPYTENEHSSSHSNYRHEFEPTITHSEDIHYVHIGLQTDSNRFGSKSVWTVHMKHAHKYV